MRMETANNRELKGDETMTEIRRATVGAVGRRRVLAGFAGLGAAGLAGPLLVGRARAETPGTVVFGLSSYPPGIAPWENKGTASNTVKLQLHRGLVGYDAAGRLQPELAGSWEIPDPRTYRFKLRDNAVFQNGEPVTAADVKYSLEAIAAEDSTAHLRTTFEVVAGIEMPSDQEVLISLKEPSATFIYQLASVHSNIVSMKAHQADPEDYVGAGPYVVTDNERGTRINMAAFDRYYKPGLPKTPKLSFVAYKDENLRVAALEAGDVDIIEYVPWQSMDSIGANPDLSLDVVDGPFMYLMFNADQGPFTDARVRQAVGYAIKREDVIAAAFFGRGNALGAMPVPKGSEYYEPKFEGHWSYDPDKAKALLAEAGLADGFTATLLSTAQYGMHKDTAEVVQQSLAGVGINVTLNLPDWATRVSLGNRGQYDFAVMGSAGDFNDPDALSNFIDGSLGDSYVRSHGLSNPQLTALLAEGRQEINPAKRKVIYDKVQELALEVAPIVPLNWRAQGYATRKPVAGFKNMPGFLTFYSGYTLETTEAGSPGP